VVSLSGPFWSVPQLKIKYDSNCCSLAWDGILVLKFKITDAFKKLLGKWWVAQTFDLMLQNKIPFLARSIIDLAGKIRNFILNYHRRSLGSLPTTFFKFSEIPGGIPSKHRTHLFVNVALTIYSRFVLHLLVEKEWLEVPIEITKIQAFFLYYQTWMADNVFRERFAMNFTEHYEEELRQFIKAKKSLRKLTGNQVLQTLREKNA